MRFLLCLFCCVLFSTLQGVNLVPSQNVKVVIFVPESHADRVREEMAKNGAGKIGLYDSCSFSTTGTARFRPLPEANPTIGKIGELEAVTEERIEALCPISLLEKMLHAVKRVHPYEEMGYDIYPLLDLE